MVRSFWKNFEVFLATDRMVFGDALRVPPQSAFSGGISQPLRSARSAAAPAGATRAGRSLPVSSGAG
jgi:hypothetical protein